jgi:hypothetical protein
MLWLLGFQFAAGATNSFLQNGHDLLGLMTASSEALRWGVLLGVALLVRATYRNAIQRYFRTGDLV